MSASGDDGSEMPGPDPFDDDAIDGLLAGTNPRSGRRRRLRRSSKIFGRQR